MYCWGLLSGNISDVPYLTGVTGDLAVAMRLCEQQLLAGRAFLGYVEVVRQAMSAHDLDSCYVRTGQIWIGRRTIHGGVRWEEREGRFGDDLLALLSLA
jgi:hypothetical protein